MERLLCRFSGVGDGQFCAGGWGGCSGWGVSPQSCIGGEPVWDASDSDPLLRMRLVSGGHPAAAFTDSAAVSIRALALKVDWPWPVSELVNSRSLSMDGVSWPAVEGRAVFLSALSSRLTSCCAPQLLYIWLFPSSLLSGPLFTLGLFPDLSTPG